MNDMQHEQISYAKTVYGQEEVDAVVKCLQNQLKWAIIQDSLKKDSKSF